MEQVNIQRLDAFFLTGARSLDTGIRDYIHVMDLADGHVAALAKLEREHLHIKMYNLGTGKGVSVMELIKTFETTNSVRVPYTIEPRRVGDISAMFADP